MRNGCVNGEVRKGAEKEMQVKVENEINDTFAEYQACIF